MKISSIIDTNQSYPTAEFAAKERANLAKLIKERDLFRFVESPLLQIWSS